MSSEGRHFLEVVATLAHEVANTAIWFGERCNWIGARPHGESWYLGSLRADALGPDLYGGTSGVAVFLAEAAVHLDDDRVRTTALGAIRHALEHAADIPPTVRDGLYGGQIGIAYSAMRVAKVLDVEEAATGALRLLDGWRTGRRSSASDVMQGRSGAVVGLGALNALIDEPWLTACAAELGDELAAGAQRTNDGWSWPTPGEREMHNLCGYAHGAAGIGHAFVELFALTGQVRFGNAAGRAFDYESSWMDPSTGAWPDLRGVARRTGRTAPLVGASSWCNGAAGIALSRLRAAEVTKSEALFRDAELGLRVCDTYARDVLAHEPEDLSLCHGAAGTGDALLSAAVTPEDPRAALAANIGRWGIAHTDGWCAAGFGRGVRPDPAPGLLNGVAGIGMFYLRLFEPRVISPLLVSGVA
jgi:lantibiotic biosynthesis protein